jgi:hypothetical protein
MASIRVIVKHEEGFIFMGYLIILYNLCAQVETDVNTTTRKTKEQMERYNKWHEETENKELD